MLPTHLVGQGLVVVVVLYISLHNTCIILPAANVKVEIFLYCRHETHCVMWKNANNLGKMKV